MTRQHTVLFILIVVLATALTAALTGSLTENGAKILTGIGGLFIAVFCRAISAWVTSFNKRLPKVLTPLGTSIGPVVIALAGGAIAISALYALLRD